MEWFVKEGDRVKEMDKLCIVESDKASVEITSRYHGIVKSIKVPANEQAKVGTVIVEIDDEEPESKVEENRTPNRPSSEPTVAESEKQPRQTEKREGGAPSAPAPSSGKSESKAAPAVRALAKTLGVDLSKVKGTGKDGRILEEDVHGFQKQNGHKASSPGMKKEAEKFEHSLESYGRAKEVKMSQVGLAMVKSMNESLKVPQLNHGEEMECGRLMDVIKTLKPVAVSSFHLPTLTLTAFMIKAVSLGISEIPIINSRIAASEDKYHLLESHNVSVAMDSPRGLVVPNIKNVQDLSLVEIQKRLIELQERTKTGRLSLDDIRGGTVSFSNIGVIGGTYAKPVIFDGQAVIGAAGRVQTVPRFDEMGNVVARRIINVSWTADHRHVDGASVARFCNVFKDAIENPEKVIALHFR